MTPIEESLHRFPWWHTGIAIYLAVLGVMSTRGVLRFRTAYMESAASSSSLAERRRIQGYWFGQLTAGATWLVGAALVLVGWYWAQLAMAAYLLARARSDTTSFASGMAAGRADVDPVATPDRVPTAEAIDWTVAALCVGAARVLPAILLLYAAAAYRA